MACASWIATLAAFDAVSDWGKNALVAGVAKVLWRIVWFILRRYKATTVSLAALLLAAWTRSEGVIEAEEYWSVAMRGFIAAIAFNMILTLFSERAAVKRAVARLRPAHDALLENPRLGGHYGRTAKAVTSRWEESKARFPQSDPQVFENIKLEVNALVHPADHERILDILTPARKPTRFIGHIRYLPQGDIRIGRRVVEQSGISQLRRLASHLNDLGYKIPLAHLLDEAAEGSNPYPGGRLATRQKHSSDRQVINSLATCLPRTARDVLIPCTTLR